jgi:hypothetical protein
VDALRSSLSVIAVIALIALFFNLSIPTQQPASARAGPDTGDGDASEPFSHATG